MSVVSWCWPRPSTSRKWCACNIGRLRKTKTNAMASRWSIKSISESRKKKNWQISIFERFDCTKWRTMYVLFLSVERMTLYRSKTQQEIIFSHFNYFNFIAIRWRPRKGCYCNFIIQNGTRIHAPSPMLSSSSGDVYGRSWAAHWNRAGRCWFTAMMEVRERATENEIHP